MSKIKSAIFFLLFICSLTACAQPVQPTVQAISPTGIANIPNTVSPSTTPLPTETLTETFTVTPKPSATATIANTPTEPAPGNSSKRCIDIRSKLSVDIEDFPEMNGRIILDVPYSRNGYIINVNNSAKSIWFPYEAKYAFSDNYSVSPDRNWVAFTTLGYYQTGQERSLLVVQSSDGETVMEFPHDYDEWKYIYQWLDNQWIELVLADNWYYDRLTLFNPFTGEKKVMSNDYPFISIESYVWTTRTIFEPTLKRLLYLQRDANYDFYITYWDRDNNQAIFEYPTNVLKTPEWSPDGKSFVFVKDMATQTTILDELMYSDWEGNLTQLTDFSPYYDYSKIDAFKWSPDGRYMAILFRTNSTRNSEDKEVLQYLFILNVETKEIIDYCIPTNMFIGYPVWSPDSAYIAVDLQKKDCCCPEDYVINLDTGAAVKIADGLTPLVWMK